MKRIISLVLSICAIIGVFAGMNFSVDASVYPSSVLYTTDKNGNLKVTKNIKYIRCSDYFVNKIILDKGNKYFTLKDGVLYNKKQTVLVRYPACKKNSSFKVPSKVTAIADSAFAGANLKDLTLPSNLKIIGDAALSFVHKKLTIPKSVDYIGDGAFFTMAPKNGKIYYKGSVSKLKKLTQNSGMWGIKDIVCSDGKYKTNMSNTSFLNVKAKIKSGKLTYSTYWKKYDDANNLKGVKADYYIVKSRKLGEIKFTTKKYTKPTEIKVGSKGTQYKVIAVKGKSFVRSWSRMLYTEVVA